MFNSNYLFRGKHASYIKYLCKKTTQNDSTAKSAELFSTYVSVYEIASLIGVAYNRKSAEDKSNADTANIQEGAMIGHKNNLEFAFVLVMLADESCGLSDDEKIDRAFKQDEDVEKTKVNMDLFNDYARGGIEWLYENLVGEGLSKQDYLYNIEQMATAFRETFFVDKN